MTFLLDSNVWITLFRNRSRQVADRLQRHDSSDIVICSVVLAELWFGALRNRIDNRSADEQVARLRNTYLSLPFDDHAAAHYAQLRAALASAGTPIGGNDMMIAAIALAHNLTLVTHNTSEFSRVPNLRIEDWQQ